MDWMFTQPLNYGFFTVPFLIWHPLSFPQQSIISSMAISESQRTEMRPGRAFTSSSSREVIFLFLVMMLLSSLLKTVSTKLFIVVQLSISVHRNNVVFSISGESWNLHLNKIVMYSLELPPLPPNVLINNLYQNFI